jgi:putative ABC transport system permease protein
MGGSLAIRRSLTIAARSLRRNRLQTALTTLGMMIGVGTVMVMMAVGGGAEKSIREQVRAAGMNVIVISSGNYRMPQQWTSQGEGEEPAAWSPSARNSPRLRDGIFYPGAVRLRRMQNIPQSPPGSNPSHELANNGENLGGLGAATTLALTDADSMRRMSGVQAVSGGVHENISVFTEKNGAPDTTLPVVTQLKGEEASLLSIRRAWVASSGRFLNAEEDERGDSVAVLGSVLSKQMFGDKNPVGRNIFLGKESFVVIGVIASGSWMVQASQGDGQFDAVYVPVRAAQRLLGRPYLDTITTATQSTGDVTRVTKLISAELRQRHHLSTNLPDDFTVASEARTAIAHGGMRTDISRAMMGNSSNLDKLTLAELSKTLEQASRTMTALLASTAAVSLVVGGIGIMNIMLLSVTERTREIGVRRAVGAKSQALMQQFLLEAVLLSLGGGILGIALGIGTSAMLAKSIHWSIESSWAAIALSFGVSAAIGIVFGFYPAREASRVSPMTSLRYE